MLAQLPEAIQLKVIEYLSSNNFTAAKQLHDDWLSKNGSNVAKRSAPKPTSVMSMAETH